MRDQPLHGSNRIELAEITFRGMVLALILTAILALSNAYLALKLGLLTSASIPAAIISMGLLRLLKNPSILENNAVQTAASAGEAVAGGIVYTIPALVIIGYWQHFDYWTNFLIALFGGVLGVLFSIPLRRILVHDPKLAFPEGRAIAEVLKTANGDSGVKHLMMGGLVGAVLELFQVGFKVLANSWSYWFVAKRSLFGFSAGFSATMIGAGYLIGYDMALSIFLGSILSWYIALPYGSHFFPEFISQYPAKQAAVMLWNAEMRYFGIGAMLFAGCWTFMKLIRPLIKSIRTSVVEYRSQQGEAVSIRRVDRDIPFLYILCGILAVAVALFLFFHHMFPTTAIGLAPSKGYQLILGALVYVLLVGFLFSVITAYFSGMVGVTASPGSAVVIAGMLFAAWLLLSFLASVIPLPLDSQQMKAAEAMTIIIGSIVTGIAAIANDNTQDLKVGQLVGATPWRQQLMLLFGVLVSALVIPPVMQLLFDVYGIAGVFPHAGMDPAQALPAPTAALMAAVTEAVFRHNLPWGMMFTGALVILGIIILNHVFALRRFISISILGVAIGMYLPLASSFPLFIGGLIALFIRWRVSRTVSHQHTLINERLQTGTLIACGLVAGSAVIDVALAVPFSILHSPDALSVVTAGWYPVGVFLSVFATIGLAYWMNYRVCHK